MYQGYFGPQRIASRYPTAMQSLAFLPVPLTIRLSLRFTISAPTIRETDRCFNELASARHWAHIQTNEAAHHTAIPRLLTLSPHDQIVVTIYYRRTDNSRDR
jgi:hypothetical protein